jgi:hypothetical protein
MSSNTPAKISHSVVLILLRADGFAWSDIRAG